MIHSVYPFTVQPISMLQKGEAAAAFTLLMALKDSEKTFDLAKFRAEAEAKPVIVAEKSRYGDGLKVVMEFDRLGSYLPVITPRLKVAVLERMGQGFVDSLASAQASPTVQRVRMAGEYHKLSKLVEWANQNLAVEG